MPKGSPARTRLDAVAATTDGFELAQLDLQLRREGDVLGSSQSGERSSLRLLEVVRDEDVIVRARAAALTVVAADPSLASAPGLLSAIHALVPDARADFMEKA
jgi:ATP-dependent DNA helicase RecG